MTGVRYIWNKSTGKLTIYLCLLSCVPVYSTGAGESECVLSLGISRIIAFAWAHSVRSMDKNTMRIRGKKSSHIRLRLAQSRRTHYGLFTWRLN